MTNIIIFLTIASLIVLVIVTLSIMRISKLKKKRTMGRSTSKNRWLDKQLLKRFTKNFPID